MSFFNSVSILDQPEKVGVREEPNTRDEFFLRDIQPARYVVTAIENIFKNIQDKRKALEASVNQAPQSVMFKRTPPPVVGDVLKSASLEKRRSNIE